MKIISLGWGVQSFTLAAMVALGELEPVQAALHADTTFESQLTYQFAERWTGWLEERGVKVVTVRDETNKINTDRRGGDFYTCLYKHSIRKRRPIAPSMYRTLEDCTDA